MRKIYTNGSLMKQLICLKGEGEKNAYFLNLENLVLIKATDVVWDKKADGSIYWGGGTYKGHIMQNLKDID